MRSTRFLTVSLICLALASDGLAQRSKTSLVRPVLRPTPNALAWQSGTFVNTQDYDCLQFGGGFSIGYIIGTYVSYYGDPNTTPATPKVGDVYYTSVYVQDVAACQGVAVQPWLILPAGTSLAISATNPVFCYKNGAAVASCNQNPQFGVSLSGAYGYNLGVWTLKASGGSGEMLVPVSSSSAGPTRLIARVDTADGWSNPSATPFKDFLVGANSSSPTVTYPSPSATSITNTTAKTTAYLSNQNIAGDIFFDLGTTTTYEDASTLPFAVYADPGVLTITCDWSDLLPGTLYHWRARYRYGSGGATAMGADQTFTTTGTAAPPAAPMYVTATTSSPTNVGITWYAVVGATSYEIWRRKPGSGVFVKLINTTPAVITATSYNDTTVLAGNAYMYKVRAVNSSGSSVDSYPDLATTVIYSDDRLTEFETIIKLAHLTQLRTAVDAVRALTGTLGPGAYTDPTPTAGVTKVKAIHILELRTQYDQAMAALTGVNQSWATTPVQGGKVTFEDFQQLRDRLK